MVKHFIRKCSFCIIFKMLRNDIGIPSNVKIMIWKREHGNIIYWSDRKSGIPDK